MTHLLRELKNTDDLENIKEIQFSLFSHHDIKNGAVSEILTPDSYDGNIPKNNGLFDHNMGSIDAAIICPTDEKKEELFNYLNNNIFNDNEIEIRIKYENEKKKFYLIVLNKNSI